MDEEIFNFIMTEFLKLSPNKQKELLQRLIGKLKLEDEDSTQLNLESNIADFR